jgi:acyl-CoA thioesterase FadM
MILAEYVVQEIPFTVRRRVRWGDCDPAGVVYTGMFGDYVISTVELFYEYLIGMPANQFRNSHGFGTPTRALEFDFRSWLAPDDDFDMVVTVREIRTRSFVLDITARKPDGREVFYSKLTPVCVSRKGRNAIVIPDILRERLEGYRSECGL